MGGFAMPRSFLAACALAVLLLAGCSSPAATVETGTSQPVLEAGKGAVTGIVIDDVYRPIPGAQVVLFPLGLLATADQSGQFGFTDLEPGPYELQVQAKAHEASPAPVDVKEGEYSEVEVQARRVFSDDGRIVTLQYSFFQPCAESAVLVSTIHGYCFLDESGDSYRPGLEGLDFSGYGANLTFVVAEMTVNQPDDYVLVMRCDDGSSFGCGEYVRSDTNGAAYAKAIIRNGTNHQMTPDSINYTVEDPMEVLVFFYGTGRHETTDVLQPVGCASPVQPTNPLNGKPALCREFYGAGHRFAVEGNIVLTLFIGEPQLDIESYGVLA
ncbi:MAG: Carboxypeptidase regulatory-like domain [Thermoplasmata archaeon]|jgi:hypothetical protein|nr:Carboxypeptidase regulatory-like domain [Thermoplasmata archaeon]